MEIRKSLDLIIPLLSTVHRSTVTQDSGAPVWHARATEMRTNGRKAAYMPFKTYPF